MTSVPAQGPDLLVINNSDETFTTAGSGAIATHIWETVRIARGAGRTVRILSRAGAEDAIEDPDLTLVAPRPERTTALRVLRRLTGFRDVSQVDYCLRVIGHVRGLDARVPVLVHNDPELAWVLATLLPRRRIAHLMHNELAMSDRSARRFGKSGVRQLAVSRYIARSLEARLALDEGSVTVVLNGADVERFRPQERSPSGAAERVAVVGFIGRLGPEKGLDVLLEAATELATRRDDFELLIVGSNTWGALQVNDYQERLLATEALLREKGVRVRRLGHVGRAEVPEVLRQFDIQVVASRWQEPCALTVFEGLATGLPVVATATGGTPEVLGDAGVLVPADDAAAMARAVESLLEDRGAMQRLAREARERARQSRQTTVC